MITITEEQAPHDPGRFWVARIDGIRAGHLFVSSDLDGRLDADVSPSFRRRGVATALYLRALAEMGEIRARLWEQSIDAYLLWEALQRRGLVQVTRTDSRATMTQVNCQPVESGGVPCVTYVCPSGPYVCDYTRALACSGPTCPFDFCIPTP